MTSQLKYDLFYFIRFKIDAETLKIGESDISLSLLFPKYSILLLSYIAQKH